MTTRLRVTYAVDGPLRYISNLDQLRAWERAARRAALPLVYSGGFHPRPRIQIAAALPVGFGARAELADLWFDRPVDPAVARAALTPAAPEGLTIVDVAEIDPADPALPAQVVSADYVAQIETARPTPELAHRIDELLAAPTLPRERRGKPYDLRPLIEQLALDKAPPGLVALDMRLAAREGATGRPEEVLDALDLSGSFYRVTRRRLVLLETPPTDQESSR